MGEARVERLVVALVYGAALVTPSGGHATELPARNDYSANERVPIALFIVTPTKGLANTSGSEILRLADIAVREKTNLTVVPGPDPKGPGGETQACEKLSCFVRVLAGDWYRKDLRLDAIRAKLRQKNVPSLLVVLSAIQQASGVDRLTPILIDTGRAIDAIYEHDLEHTPEDELEVRIVQDAVRASPPPEKVSSEGIHAYLTRLFQEDFRGAFEQLDHWEPYGTIEIESAESGFEIAIDDVLSDPAPGADPSEPRATLRLIGPTNAGRTVISEVMPGRRTVAVSLPGFEPFTTTVLVERGRRARVEAKTVRQGDDLARMFRTGLVGSGIALAIAGIAVSFYALKEELDPAVHAVCVKQAGESCGSPEFRRFGSRDIGRRDANPNGNGIPIFPLGYSLFGMGATFSLGTLLFDDGSFPWIQTLAGIGVGVGALLVSHALDGKNGVCSDPSSGATGC